MTAPDWQSMLLNDGVLREPIPDNSQIVLWLLGARADGFQYWERIGSIAHAEFVVEGDLCAVAATSLPARQPTGGLLGGFWRRLRTSADTQTWLLPNGKSAEQCGDRRADLLLAWTKDGSVALEESRVKARWPQCQRLERIGKNLYLVRGVEPPGAKSVPLPQGNPRQQAEQMLLAARQKGDRRGEAQALTDLGIVLMSEKDVPRASVHLEAALAIARELGDRACECDVLGNAGMVALAGGQVERARHLFEQELALARAGGDRFGEKLALEHVGIASGYLGDAARALACFEEALDLARAAGDRQQEANLLWQLGIVYAELGRREEAVAQAQAAVDLLAGAGKPAAEVFADHLQKYRRGESGAVLRTGVAAAEPGSIYGGAFVASAMHVQAAQSPAQGATGPGLLRMALSVAHSMGKFLGSGLKTATPEILQKRLRTCSMCEHHTGVRCKICGCFTSVKARMFHEDCPIGKWQA